MKQQPFKFELESVLRVRERETERARDAAERAAGKVTAQRQALKVLEDQLRREMTEVQETKERGRLMTLRRSSARQGQIRSRIQKEHRLLDKYIEEHRTAITKLVKCRMNEETIIQLRDNAYDQYRKAVEQAENAYTDELVQLTSARTARENL
jgi:hypothetical protein